MVKSSSSSSPSSQWGFVMFIILCSTIFNTVVVVLVMGGNRGDHNTVCRNSDGAIADHLDSFASSSLTKMTTTQRQIQIADTEATIAAAAAAAAAAIPSTIDPCQFEYERMTSNQTRGLTLEDYRKSWSHVGSRKRLAKLVHKLQEQREPILAVVSGGSISLGHGVVKGLRYSDRLEHWMNDKFPLAQSQSQPQPQPQKHQLKQLQRHKVLNKGSHGADICAMAKRLKLLMEDLPDRVDLFVLEFAVNDYQGQDHKTMIDFKMDVFFDGFDSIATCTETVLHRLLHRYPDAAIVFLEMRTAIAARKTASLLHLGAAQHYQVPVISYDQALFPDYQFLLSLIRPFNYSTRRGDTVLPYPHGCHPCIREHIDEAFRNKGCATVCRIQQFSPVDPPKNCTIPQQAQDREPCYVPFFAHDEVHPSGVGHQIASDLIVDAIATTARDVCRGETAFDRTAAVIPVTGWMVADPTKLNARHNFLMVNDTYEIFVEKRHLQASSHTAGFTYYEDAFGRFGWIATNPSGGETVIFDIHFPVQPDQCYVPYLSVLKSYEKMGAFTIAVLDRRTQRKTVLEVDGLWTPRISVPSDIALAEDDASPPVCTGECQISVTTQPQVQGRNGNKVKIVTLSVRKCIRGST